jgi:hypothetical protein
MLSISRWHFPSWRYASAIHVCQVASLSVSELPATCSNSEIRGIKVTLQVNASLGEFSKPFSISTAQINNGRILDYPHFI